MYAFHSISELRDHLFLNLLSRKPSFFTNAGPSAGTLVPVGMARITAMVPRAALSHSSGLDAGVDAWKPCCLADICWFMPYELSTGALTTLVGNVTLPTHLTFFFWGGGGS